ncbi:hypothetical protein Hamer_G002301 [Homarus americanus]|uniref:HTH CENPB-type domain-containing protein n=1 Tax=Homarus americanus TaxID=6706 RepID=A0A8J5JVR3_HOMAM|nr:hypothetical protein Hamer_G002301 [Homarus americanus]
MTIAQKKRVDYPPPFNASVGWLAAFKKRYEVKLAHYHGESELADVIAAEKYPPVFPALVKEGGYCRDQIAPKASRLADHEKSKGHSSTVAASSMCRALPVMTAPRKRDSENKKRVEFEFAVAISSHCSTASVHHLGEMMKSELENLQLHRTKCNKLLFKVIAPALFEELKEDAKGKSTLCLLTKQQMWPQTSRFVLLRGIIVIQDRELSRNLCGLVPTVGATDADPEELVLHHKSLQDRNLYRNGKPLPLNMVDYGAKFMHELYTFINQQNHSAEAVGKGKCCRDFKVAPHMMELFNSEKEEQDDDRLDVFAYVN